MEDLIKTLGMQLAGDPRIQAHLRQAISQGIGTSNLVTKLTHYPRLSWFASGPAAVLLLWP
jgi:hypothetical protein